MLLCIFKLDEGEEKLEYFDSKKMIGSNGKLVMRREINIERIDLNIGKYAIIPSAKEARSGKFYLSYYYSCADDKVNLSRCNGKLDIEPYDIPEEEEDFKFPPNLKELIKSLYS